MITESYILTLIESYIDAADMFLVEVKVKPGNKITVFIDSEKGVGIDDCVALSRFIESKLDREAEDFELEVSSAGLDMPLRHIRQYKKNIGHRVDVVTKEGLKKTGTLISADKEGFTIQHTLKPKAKKTNEEQIFHFLYQQVKSTKIVVNI